MGVPIQKLAPFLATPTTRNLPALATCLFSDKSEIKRWGNGVNEDWYLFGDDTYSTHQYNSAYEQQDFHLLRGGLGSLIESWWSFEDVVVAPCISWYRINLSKVETVCSRKKWYITPNSCLEMRKSSNVFVTVYKKPEHRITVGIEWQVSKLTAMCTVINHKPTFLTITSRKRGEQTNFPTIQTLLTNHIDVFQRVKGYDLSYNG